MLMSDLPNKENDKKSIEEISLRVTRSWFESKILSEIKTAAEQGLFEVEVEISSFKEHALIRHASEAGFELIQTSGGIFPTYKIIW